MANPREIRLAEQDAEIEALIKEAEGIPATVQEGSTVDGPTQSLKESMEGSPSGDVEGTAGKVVETEDKDTLAYWKNRALVSEQRYNVSKPKYDSNIHKLKQENVKLQQSRLTLQKALNEAHQKISSKKVDKLDELFDGETVDVLGEKTVSAFKNAIKSTNDRVTKQEEAAAAAEVKANELKLSNDVQGEYNVFLSDLTRLVPDQAQLNTDKGFLAYLDGVDDFSGKVRFDLLKKAEVAREAAFVARFFLDYKESIVKPAAKPAVPADSVSKRIAPTNNGSSSVTSLDETGGKVTLGFIKQFDQEVRQGLYKGRHKEQQAIDDKIDQAYITGNLI